MIDRLHVLRNIMRNINHIVVQNIDKYVCNFVHSIQMICAADWIEFLDIFDIHMAVAGKAISYNNH